MVAEGNAVVVHRELVREGAEACGRTVQLALADRRREKRAAAVETVRYETAVGQQMQVDFGQKKVWVGAALVTVDVLVATLSYSRRVFVKASSGERTPERLDGIAAAFQHFAGVPRVLLCDRARCLVASTDRATGAATFTPALLLFCRDWCSGWPRPTSASTARCTSRPRCDSCATSSRRCDRPPTSSRTTSASSSAGSPTTRALGSWRHSTTPIYFSGSLTLSPGEWNTMAFESRVATKVGGWYL